MRPLSLPIAIVLLLGALESGSLAVAQEYEVVRGQRVELSKQFGFYFYRSDDLQHPVVVVRDEVANLIISGAKWSVPQGLSLQERKVEIGPGAVGWQEGSEYGSADGLWLKITATVKVKDDAPVGDSKLYLVLPRLDSVASIIGADPLESPSQRFPSSILVESFKVYESEKAMWPPSRIIESIVVAAIIVGILGSQIWGAIRRR
jgi:hypothetical protein